MKFINNIKIPFVIFFITLIVFGFDNKIYEAEHLKLYYDKFLNPLLINDFSLRITHSIFTFILNKITYIEHITIAVVLNYVFVFLIINKIFNICKEKEYNSKKTILILLSFIQTFSILHVFSYGIYFIICGIYFQLLYLTSKNSVNSSIFCLLTLLTHPSFIFFMPLMIYYKNYKILSIPKIVMNIFLYFSIYVICYLILEFLNRYFPNNFHKIEVGEVGFYQNSENMPIIIREILWRIKENNFILDQAKFLIFGIFIAFKSIWIISILILIRNLKLENIIFFILILFGILANIFFGADTTKYVSLILPCLFVYIIDNLKNFQKIEQELIIAFLIIGNTIIPAGATFANNITFFNNSIMIYLKGFFL